MSEAGPARPLRILEVGHLHFVQEAFPEETERVDTNFYLLPGQGALAKLRAVGAQFRQLCVLTFRRQHDLVFCRCFGRFIYRRDVPLPVNALRSLMSALVAWCIRIKVARGARLAVVDALDEMTIDGRDLDLVRRCDCYFKRELPQNAWNVFLRIQPAHGEFNDLTRDPAFTAHLDKFAPVSIGITSEKVRRIEEVVRRLPPGEKQIDVFYAGGIQHSTVRQQGFLLLEKLRERGYRVEVRQDSIPFEEFVEKMHRAWLVWSPEGQGWECYRHYEACVAGSIPLVNQAGIRRYQPLLAGVHCVQYAVEGDDLCAQVERALADRAALLAMAAAAREHTLQFHTNEKLGGYMVRHALAAGKLGAGRGIG